MDFEKLIYERRSCHNFEAGRNIPKDQLVKLIDYARFSPSGYNAQPWEFLIVDEEKAKKAICDIAFSQAHLPHASAFIVVLADTMISRNVHTLLDDWIRYGYCTEAERPVYYNSIAKNRSHEKRHEMALRNAMLPCMSLLLGAENLGLSACPIMGFSGWKLQEHFQIPEDRSIALLIALGYGKKEEEKPQLPRKSCDSLIHWNEFKLS